MLVLALTVHAAMLSNWWTDHRQDLDWVAAHGERIEMRVPQNGFCDFIRRTWLHVQVAAVVWLTATAGTSLAATGIAWDAAAQIPGTNWEDLSILYGTQAFRILADGSRVTNGGYLARLTLQGRTSGTYGVQQVSVAKRIGDTVDAMDSTFTPVTFGVPWTQDVYIAANSVVTSSPFAFNVVTGQDLFITLCVTGRTGVGVGALVYRQDPGPAATIHGWSVPSNAASGVDWTEQYSLSAYAKIFTASRLFVVATSASNRAPDVDAGADWSNYWLVPASLTGAVLDDGRPNFPGVTTTQWTKVSGPGLVSFSDAASEATIATVSTGGAYVVRLTAYDGQTSSWDEVSLDYASSQAPPASLPTTNIVWEQVVGAVIDDRSNPLAYVREYVPRVPALGDIDGDGDLDLLTLQESGDKLWFHRNIGTRASPQWAPAVRDYGVNMGLAATGFVDTALSKPSLVDIDGDGDLDLFLGPHLFENTGTVAIAQWAPAVSNAIPAYDPVFVDIDVDGDYDLYGISGYVPGMGSTICVTLYRNTGTAEVAQWEPPQHLNDPICSFVNYNHTVKYLSYAFGDIDDDGDPDFFYQLWLQNFAETNIFMRKNVGSASSPSWGPSTAMPPGRIQYPRMCVEDLDGDGDRDFFCCANNPYFYEVMQMENVGSPTSAAWAGFTKPMTPIVTSGGHGYSSWPAIGDTDGDGDLDAYVAGNDSCTFLRNDGSPTVLRWASPTNIFTDYNSATFLVTPAFGDLDGDGDLDLIDGDYLSYDGFMNYSVNTGTVNSPAWGQLQAAALPITYGFPALADIDGDGDIDVFTGQNDGTLSFYRNTGTMWAAQWAPAMVRYGGIDAGKNARPSFGDVDGDGDLDLAIGVISNTQGIVFSENVGARTNAIWAPCVSNFVGSRFVPTSYVDPYVVYTVPNLFDADGDGDADLIAGSSDGGVRFFRNSSPKLLVTPPQLTLVAGAMAMFSSPPTNGSATWSFITNRSGGSLGGSNGVYLAGTNAPVIDVIEARVAGGLFGRVHVNVIRPEDATAVGKAIVIAGGKALDDPVWGATDALAGKAYLTLLHRGFAKTNVHYLSFGPAQDVDADGLMDDIDGDSSAANAGAAFTSFAQNADKLFVYLANHGSDTAGQGYMRLNAGENLSAAQLDSWLDALQSANTNLAVTVVLDFCYAGSFLDELALTNSTRRVVMAATAPDQLTYFIAGGLVSFSDAFFASLQAGFDFKSAFEVARGAMSSYQLAQMDDDGNGVFELGVDGENAESNSLGASFIAGLDIPQIGDISPNQLITTGTTATLWAKDVSSVYPIERTWCLVVPPSHNPNTNAGIPVLNIPEMELLFNQNLQRYETTFDGFTEPGTYKVIFLAKDIWGGVCLPKQSFITQSNFVEKAVLVAGSSASNVLAIAAHAHATLHARLFTSNTIQFLSGTSATPASLSDAITNWGNASQRLAVYLIGIDTNYIATEVDAWLDSYQASNRAVTAILEFDGSGGWSTNLVPPANRERIVIASTQAGYPSLMEEGGTVSFSEYFLSEIFGGKTIGQAVTKARKAIRRASGLVRQRAGMDDDGDGILNEKNQDGSLANTRYLGAAFATGGEGPNIGQVLPVTALTNDTSLVIWAGGVTDADGISNAWCMVTPPEYDETGDLVRVDLVFTNSRYEALYADFTNAGGYTLTFYAEDNVGDVSPAVQSEVIRPDKYEVDDSHSMASPINVGLPQLHTFHVSTDQDWMRFYAESNYVYEISTFHLSTNVDTVVDVYHVDGDGQLILIDHVDDFGFEEGELLGLDFPQTGLYLAHVTQFETNGSGPGSYDVNYDIPAGAGAVVVSAVDYMTAAPLPVGAYVSMDGGVPRSFLGSASISFVPVPGWHSFSVSSGNGGIVSMEDKNYPGQVQNSLNEGYGNPRSVNIPNVPIGQVAKSIVFWFVPRVLADGDVRDLGTYERVSGAGITFKAAGGYLTNYVINGDPFYANYKSLWASQDDGQFPNNVWLPAQTLHVTLGKAGYQDYNQNNVIVNPVVGSTPDVGTKYMAPVDHDGDGMGDNWETLNFGTTTNGASGDVDGDGHNNWQEYKLGTSPGSAGDQLEDNYSESPTKNITLKWTVKDGRTYRVMRTDTLYPPSWTLAAGPWEATTGQTQMQWTANPPDTLTSRYFRIEALVP